MKNGRANRPFPVGVLVILVAIVGCSEMGKKYAALNVTSAPPGAAVEAMLQHKSFVDGKETKFPVANLGPSPTGVRVVHFAFGAPGAGDAQVGVRVTKEGYEPYELLFEASDWHNSDEEARQHVKEITVALKEKAILSKGEQQGGEEERQGAPQK